MRKRTRLVDKRLFMFVIKREIEPLTSLAVLKKQCCCRFDVEISSSSNGTRRIKAFAGSELSVIVPVRRQKCSEAPESTSEPTAPGTRVRPRSFNLLIADLLIRWPCRKLFIVILPSGNLIVTLLVDSRSFSFLVEWDGWSFSIVAETA